MRQGRRQRFNPALPIRRCAVRRGVVMYKFQSNRATLCAVGVTLAALAGCEATSHRVGQSASVQFGVVQSAQEVTLDSQAAQGAIIGGTIGVLASGRGSRGRGAVTGAAVGGATTAVAQGNRTGTQYTVQM